MRPLPLHAGGPAGAATRWRAVWSLTRDAATAWVDDYAASMGAAIAFYTLFSLAPLLLIVISVAGMIFGEEAARGEIFAQLRGLFGAEGAMAIQGLLKSVQFGGGGLIGTVSGAVLLAIGATTVFAELQNALDRIWKAPQASSRPAWWILLRTRLTSFGLILAIGFLLIVSLVASAAFEALSRWWAPLFSRWQVLAEAINLSLSFVLTTALFALIYKLLPRVRIAWPDVTIGALVTAALFTLGKFLIGYYIGHTAVASGFGAASSIVVLLVWVYYSAQIFLAGAEFTWAYAHRYGSRRAHAQRPGGPLSPAAPSRSDA